MALSIETLAVQEPHMAARSFRVTLTRAEAGALLSAAEAGTSNAAIDQLGWTESKKLAYRRARQRIIDAMRA